MIKVILIVFFIIILISIILSIYTLYSKNKYVSPSPPTPPTPPGPTPSPTPPVPTPSPTPPTPPGPTPSPTPPDPTPSPTPPSPPSPGPGDCSECDGHKQPKTIKDLGCVTGFYDCCQLSCTSKDDKEKYNLNIRQCDKFGKNPKKPTTWNSICKPHTKSDLIADCTILHLPKLINDKLYVYGNYISGQKFDLKCGDYLTGIIKKCGNMKNDITIIIRLLSYKSKDTGWRGLRLMIPGSGSGANKTGCQYIFPNLYKQQCMSETDNGFNKCKKFNNKSDCEQNKCLFDYPFNTKQKNSAYKYNSGGIQNSAACELLNNSNLSTNDNDSIIKICKDVHIDIFMQHPYGHPMINNLRKLDITKSQDNNIILDFNKNMEI